MTLTSLDSLLPWRTLVRLPDEELARVDIAAMDLACAAGLPGCDDLDVPAGLRRLDEWTGSCWRFTERVMPMFHAGRCDYPDSEPRFRVQAMISHLQRDLGIRFRFDRRSDDAVYEPQDSFITGVLRGLGGTCASLPVLYMAVGRRLGYPIMLAATRGHLYCRWDAEPGGEVFNIEGSGDGISFFPDEHYRTGPKYEMPAEAAAACGFLRSHSPREDLAGFLVERGECWRELKNYNDAMTAYAWANELAPDWAHTPILIAQGFRLWDEAIQARRFWGFPALDLGIPASQFQHPPREAEKNMIWMRVTEDLLNDPDYERRWWGPLRRNPGVRPPGLPETLRIDFRWNQPGRTVPANR
ncbi:MAG: transglutaminase-like domain-containing protein [Gemmataceae bacterium]|nr:transglutaminase-like domain-containing protein [Gemmataceae bacterium]